MPILKGISISPGFAIGNAAIYDYEVERRLKLPSRNISHREVESECERLDDALKQCDQALQLFGQVSSTDPLPTDASALAEIHSVMAEEIADLVKQYIGREFVNAERALDSVVAQFVERFQGLNSEYFREREQDIRDVGGRMMRHLAGCKPWPTEYLPPHSVLVARELMPSEAIDLARSGLAAIVSEHGGNYSHTAIVARSLGIPAITGISNVTTRIQPGTRLLVDAEAGTVVVEPTRFDEERLVQRKRASDRVAAAVAADEKLACVTRDGVKIELRANIGRPEEGVEVAEHNLAGTGLFRTEFLFLESHQRPTLEQQQLVYNSIARALDGLPVVIRTFDLGGDKIPPFLLTEKSQLQASLHLRGLRFSLVEQRLLDTQLRAISRVAQSSDVRILFPMVIGAHDLAQGIAAVDKVVYQLGLGQRPAVGAMIETPAALYALDEICDLADFVALGTNDLTQYMLATDRDLSDEPDDCTAMHPAVLRAIKQVIQTAHKYRRPVCVCGEEAGDPAFACLLVGLGVRELSLSPSRAAAVRHVLRRLDCIDAQQIADLALSCRTPQQVRELVEPLYSTSSQLVTT